jgi:hypothetical protein
MDENHGSTVLGGQVAERVSVEQRFIQQLRKDMGATKIRRPKSEPIGGGTKNPRPQLALPVFAEKPVLKILKDPVAVEAVVGGGETSAGQGIDDVQLVDQPFVNAFPPDRCSRRFLQHAIGQG